MRKKNPAVCLCKVRQLLGTPDPLLHTSVVNLDSMSRERQQECLDNIESSMEVLKKYLEENIALKKSKEDIPVTGMAVLRQQYTLAEAIEEWIASLKKEINS